MDHLDLDLRELNQMLAIAAEGSFAQAARRLHISQPALSRSIQEVERKTGLRLFERGRQGATPTDVGQVVLRHAETVTVAAGALQAEEKLLRQRWIRARGRRITLRAPERGRRLFS